MRVALFWAFLAAVLIATALFCAQHDAAVAIVNLGGGGS